MKTIFSFPKAVMEVSSPFPLSLAGLIHFEYAKQHDTKSQNYWESKQAYSSHPSPIVTKLANWSINSCNF